MSWLTDLAGKAENLLNKIDQNAAVVLKDKSLLNEQLTDVIWNSASSKTVTSADQDGAPEAESVSPNSHSLLFPRLARSSPSGAPSPILRSSPRSDTTYSKKNDEDDLLRFLNNTENVPTSIEDARGSPSGASIPSSPVPSYGHSRSHSQGETSSVSSSYTSLVRDDPLPQHCFKPVHSLKTVNYDGYRADDVDRVPTSDIFAENNMLKNEVRCLNNELTLLHQRCKAAEKEVGVIGKELQTLREVHSQNQNLKEELSSLRLQLSGHHQEPSSVCDEGIKSVNSESESKLNAALEKNDQLQSEHDTLVEEMKELHLHVSRLQAALSEATLQSERHRQQLQAVTQDAEQYRARATRVLQEKERLIARLEKGEQNESDSKAALLEQEVEQLREEIHLLHSETASQAELLRVARQNLQEVETQKEQNRQTFDSEMERLQNRLQEERSRRIATEDDYRNQTEELRKARSEFRRQNEALDKCLKETEAKLVQLQNDVTHSQNSSQGNSNIAELEMRVRHLATALMQKQGALEALIAERNALQLQIEKNEKKYKSSQSTHTNEGIVVSLSENALRSRVPTLMAESPTDNKVARHVKRAYSGLDKLGIQVGVFLRRYPLARIFVICYMVLLHFWVALVLFSYSPESHSPLQNLEISSAVSPKEPNSLQ